MIRLDHVILKLKEPVVNDEKIDIYHGQITCITGKSGAGKTTFLYILGLLDNMTDCDYYLNEHKINLKDENEKAKFRKQNIGYVFQDYNLISYLNISENIKLWAKISGLEADDNQIRSLLDKIHLNDKTGKEYPAELSGGQKQRIAIAMALIKRPDLLILDEPTSALDSKNTRYLMELLREIAKEDQLMIMIATHSNLVLEYADKVYNIVDHKIKCVKKNKENIEFINSDKKVEAKIFSCVNFVINYFKKHFTNKLILTLLCSLVIAIFVSSTVVSKGIIKKQEELLSNITNNEIVVTNNLFDTLYSQTARPFDKEELEKIKNVSGIENYCKFYTLKVNKLISGNQEINANIEIQPYAANMNIEEFQNQDNKIYISYDLAKILSVDQYPLSICLDITLPTQTDVKLTNVEMKVESYLESIYSNRYTNTNNIIYIEENYLLDLLDKLYGQLDLEVPEPSMILVYSKSYSMVYQIDEAIQNFLTSSRVECDFIDMTSVKESTQSIIFYTKLISYSLYIIAFLMLIIIYSRYIVNREYEFCMLKTNGLMKKEINKIVFTDILLQSLLFFIASISFEIVIGWILTYFNLYANISVLTLVIWTYVVSLGILIVPAIISLKIVNRFSPAEFLRK